MAILTVSRQIASLGDELCMAIAQRLGYRFVSRKDIEQKIIELGFPEKKLKKFDEINPGFFASLSSDRDEYLDYLQSAIYSAAADDNCVIIGRGSFIILKDLPNHISLKFIAEKKLRAERYQNEHNCSQKQALKIIDESDKNRDGFNKSFFSFDRNDPAMFHLIINTGLLENKTITDSIESLVHSTITSEKTLQSMEQLQNLLISKKISNQIKYNSELKIRFFRAEVKAQEIILHGITNSRRTADSILALAHNQFPEYKINSVIIADPDCKF